MSRRNRHNRFADQPNIEESRQPASPVSPVIIEEADEEEKVSIFTQIGTFFGGCREKIAVFFQSATSTIWSVICAIPSYCVIRWDSEEEADGSQQTADDRRQATVRSREPATVSPSPDPDEDELAAPRWWNLGIKTAAASVAVLILVGGYFVAKPLLFPTSTEVVDFEIEALPLAADSPSAETEFAVAIPEPRIPQPPPQSAWDMPPAAAVPRVPPDPPASPEPPAPAAVIAAPQPPQGTLLDDPFFAAAPVPAAPVPPPVFDAFADIQIVPEPPSVPTVEPNTLAANVIASEPPQPSLQPLAPLEQPQLQPLVALGASTFSSAAVPAPAAATASPAIAANRNPQRNQNNRSNQNNPAFTAPPTPPVVNTLPPTAAQPTIALVELIPDVVPQIPASGTVQNVPPPVAPPTPVAEVAPVMYPNESAPAIPRDAPVAAAGTPPVVVVPPVDAPAVVSADNQSLDFALWEQIWELQNEPTTTPSNLRFTNESAPSEPALRFTPIEAVAPVEETMNPFTALMPARELSADELQPNSGDIEKFLPVLENAPQAVFAVPSPAYREGQVEGAGVTFQRRVYSEVSRSPSTTEMYVVQQGDTYMAISDRFYGTSLLYTALAQHNQKLGIGWRPAAGAVIEVPTAEFLRMHYGESPHQAERRLDSQRQSMRYVVQEGDTVFRLATDRLQDSTRWREIYAMNADRIQDVRELQPGMEILLPVATTQLDQQGRNF